MCIIQVMQWTGNSTYLNKCSQERCLSPRKDEPIHKLLLNNFHIDSNMGEVHSSIITEMLLLS